MSRANAILTRKGAGLRPRNSHTDAVTRPQDRHIPLNFAKIVLRGCIWDGFLREGVTGRGIVK